MDLLTFDNKTFALFATCAGVLGINLVIKAPLTAIQRIKNKAFANQEDVMANKKDKDAVKKQVRTCDDVERVRRAHLNDLENVPSKFKQLSTTYCKLSDFHPTNCVKCLPINRFRVNCYY